MLDHHLGIICSTLLELHNVIPRFHARLSPLRLLISADASLNAGRKTLSRHRKRRAAQSRIQPLMATDVFVSAGATQVHGLLKDGVGSFRGIQYGTIPQRFRQAVYKPLEDTADTVDATKFGPHCPQLSDPAADRVKHLSVGLEDPVDLQSELDCLRVNVYSPADAFETSAKLPVHVWIHGGALVVGDGNEKNGGVELVRRSIDLGQPIVHVTLNYRLGLFGHLHSRELEDEASRNEEDGFANQGLADQRLALRWVKDHIHHFGGDPAQITLAGESAGAYSVLAHLRSTTPVCRRAIIMSLPKWPLNTEQDIQRIFDQFVEKAGVSSSASSEEKLAAIRNLSSQALLELVPPFLGFTWDRKWFHEEDLGLPLEEMKHFPPWLDSIIVGSTKDEIALWGLPALGLDGEQLEHLFTQAVPDQDFRQEISALYGMVENDQDSMLAALIRLGTDSLFTGVAAAIASRSPVPASLYTFDQPDSFPESPYRGYAYHALDCCFWFRYPAVAGPDAPRDMLATADFMTRSLCDFVYGSQPWDAFDVESARLMSIDGTRFEMRDHDALGRIKLLTSTPERAAAFEAAGEHILNGAQEK